MLNKLHSKSVPLLDEAGDAGAAGGGATPPAQITKPPNGATTGKLWAGRFKSEGELEKGYENQFTETQRIIAESKSKDDRIAALERATQELTGGQNRESGGGTSIADYEAELQANFVPVAAVRKLVENVTNEMIERRVLTPIGSAAAAREGAATTFGDDFALFEANRSEFFKDNPQAKEMHDRLAAGNQPDVALYSTMGHFRAWKAANASRLSASGAEQQAAARRQAGIMGGHAVPTPDEKEAHEASLKAARERVARTGIVDDDYLERRFKGTSVEAQSRLTGGKR